MSAIVSFEALHDFALKNREEVGALIKLIREQVTEEIDMIGTNGGAGTPAMFGENVLSRLEDVAKSLS